MAVTVDQLLPRLLVRIGEQSLVALEQHLDVHGPSADLRRWAPQDLIALVESAGLRGHGGASFPMAKDASGGVAPRPFDRRRQRLRV